MLLVLLLAMQTGTTREASPVLQFPTPGLDDPAAYEGYSARVYRDSRGNALEIYIDGKTGRVVHLWADALNESIGFTVRRAADTAAAGKAAADTAAAGNPAAVAFGEEKASVWSRGAQRSLLYSLTIPGGRATQIGHFLLGSMRIERDFGYAGRVNDPIDAPTFVPQEFRQLAERDSVYAKRLAPMFSVIPSTWRVRVIQRSLDGKNRLALSLTGDARLSRVSLRDRVVTVRPRGADPITIAVEVTTDGAPLTPLRRNQIFNTAFLRFADSAQSQRLEREIRGFELLSSKQKLMAGLPTYATYFGRDMLMTALLMEPVWSDTMAEFVMGAALAKLSPDGEVSHEEALGGQAIRENAAEFLRTGDSTLLKNLQATRENYWMVDDDFQLPVVAGHYFADANVPEARKKRFVTQWGAALRKNLAYVARQAAPYAREPVPKNLVSFKRDPDGWCHPGSWRDSRVGYAGGCFAFDVNVVWVPAALRAIGTIDSALRALGEPAVDGAAEIAQSAEAWRNTARHFMVALTPEEVAARVGAKIGSLAPDEASYWSAVVARSGVPSDTLRFPAVSLDSAGQPIPVMTTDPAMWLLLERQEDAREQELLRPFLLPYPVGLFIDGVGLAVANDAYARPEVWAMFERDLYHSPRVVWGREVNTLVAALLQNGRSQPGPIDSVRSAVARSGLQYAELWSYRFEGGAVRAVRYGSSSDVQLWTLADIAVQYLLNSPRPPQ
ncbi:MAG TPA: hypothetical protein VJ755_08810 [Gemmatimonadales bacterium]|nr:hypothetical protein [Gemmatimonadales bacterium]